MLLRRLIPIALFLAGLLCVWYVVRGQGGTSYYVDNSCTYNGTGACNGTAPACACAASNGAAGPFNSIANVQSAVTGDQHGNSVLLKAGETFREQYTVPAYGTSGGQFTVGSYGSGPPPLVLGSTAASTAGDWTPVTGSVSGSVSQVNIRLSTLNGTSFVDFNAAGELTPYTGLLLTVTDHAGKHLTGYIKAAGSSESYGSELLGNTAFSNTSNLWTVSANISSVAGGQSGNALQVATTAAYGIGAQSFTVAQGMLIRASAYLEKGTETAFLDIGIQDPTYTQLIISGYNLPSSWTQYAIYATANATSSSFYQSYQGATSGQTSLFDTASVKQVTAPSATGVTIISTAGGSTYNWTSMDAGFNLNDSGGYTYSIAGAPVANLWQTTGTFATTPGTVWRDNAPLTLVAGTGSLTTVKQYYYNSSTVYVYSASNPTAAGDTFEIPQLAYGITVSGKPYVTVSGVNVSYVNSWAVNFDTSSTYGMVTGSSQLYNYGGTQFSYSDHFTFSGNMASYCLYDCVDIYYSNNGSAFGNNFSHAGMQNDDRSGLSIFGAAAGNSVYWNVSHDHTDQTGAVGVRGFIIDTVGTNVNRMYQNLAYHCNGGGFSIYKSSNQVLYGNVSHDNQPTNALYIYGIEINAVGGTSDGNLVYGNTVYNNFFAGIFANTSSNTTIKNNIVECATGTYGLFAGTVTSHIVDYNDWYGCTQLYDWNNVTYSTPAAFYSATGQGQHDISAAPTFYNATAGQLWQTVGSPGIAAGTPLGAPYNVGIQPGSSWPFNVFTVTNANSDLGAYPYTGSVIDSVMGSGMMASGTVK